MADKLAELVARAEITDSLLRYARAVDRRDWSAVRDAYHPDAHDEHGEFSGGVDEFIDWVSKRHADIPFSMHFLGNSLIEFRDEVTAFVETYFVAMRRTVDLAHKGNGAAPPEIDGEVIGRYLDRFEKRDGAWRVARRCVVYDSSRTVPSSHKPRTARGALGRRDAGDPVFSWFESSGRSG